MAYTVKNYKTKKEVITDFKAGKPIEVYQPNGDITGFDVKDGVCYLEGPHYPQPHKWYLACYVKDKIITGIKK